jgi:hypothetical protein
MELPMGVAKKALAQKKLSLPTGEIIQSPAEP